MRQDPALQTATLSNKTNFLVLHPKSLSKELPQLPCSPEGLTHMRAPGPPLAPGGGSSPHEHHRPCPTAVTLPSSSREVKHSPPLATCSQETPSRGVHSARRPRHHPQRACACVRSAGRALARFSAPPTAGRGDWRVGQPIGCGWARLGQVSAARRWERRWLCVARLVLSRADRQEVAGKPHGSGSCMIQLTSS